MNNRSEVHLSAAGAKSVWANIYVIIQWARFLHVFRTASFPTSFEFFWFPIHCTRLHYTADPVFSSRFGFNLFCLKYFSRSLSRFVLSFLYFFEWYTIYKYCIFFIIFLYIYARHAKQHKYWIHFFLFPLWSVFLSLILYATSTYEARNHHAHPPSHVVFSAFLSTENDLHHNLRPNIGGHTSRHNHRVPSEGKLKRAKRGRGVIFRWEEGREARFEISREKRRQKEKGKNCGSAKLRQQKKYAVNN